MSEVLTMSHRERDHVTIIRQIHSGRMSVREAAELCKLSQRQLYRLLSRYRAEGDRGLIHRLRGHPSNRGYEKEIRTKAVTLYWQEYRDYGPTLFSEMLLEYHGLKIDHETLRRWLHASGGSAIRRKKRPHRRKRPRRAAIGEMVQFDGSPHQWFEDRGVECCLLHGIDDATGRIFMRFAPSENVADVLVFWREYCTRFGIPRSIYTDYSSALIHDGTLTDAGRALTSLGIEIILAHSPQAKGRVERGHRTHQDRLIKALRRENISVLGQANRYLDEHYLDEHNARFALPGTFADVHRDPSGLDLTNIFCFQTQRVVRNDYTITLDASYFQLLSGRSPLPPPGRRVTVRRWLDDSLHIFWEDHELNFESLAHKPKSKSFPRSIPSPSHPWRHMIVGKIKRTSTLTQGQV